MHPLLTLLPQKADGQQKGKNCFANPMERKKGSRTKRTIAQEVETPQNQEEMSVSSDSDGNNDSQSGNDSADDAEASKWLEALAAAAPGDAFYKEDKPQLPLACPRIQVNNDEELDKNNVDYYLRVETPPEQCFEEVWSDLPPLPKENVPYPQEDTAYFASKTEPNYVRNDKITLNEILSIAKTLKDHPLPSMRSVYQDKVEVERKGW